MKVSDVNIEIIHKLLLSVPQGMQIKSIDLTNGYSLNLVAGVEEINAVEREIALDDLKSITIRMCWHSERGLSESKWQK